MQDPNSKLTLASGRTRLPATEVQSLLDAIFQALGFDPDIAGEVAAHLVDASLSGVESHGVMRVLEYAAQVESGYLTPSGRPRVVRDDAGGPTRVEAGGGIGIPALRLAYDTCCDEARARGLSALSIRHVGHTGRHGAFAEAAAEAGCLTICLGGGNRQTWRQVAPHGGARAMLPTNPWCIGIPGGDRGPVVLDFATSKIAGGWIYAARSAGALLPEGCVIDAQGHPTRNPEDYFAGGAILPAGGHKGFGLALLGELVGEALLGPSTTECNWLLIALSAERFRDAPTMAAAAEEVLDELRRCPPAPGSSGVEIPGERERAHRAASGGVVSVPRDTWRQIETLADRLGVSAT